MMVVGFRVGYVAGRFCVAHWSIGLSVTVLLRIFWL